jgi:uncharacterized membrane protein YdbT with pleckstrin-like domain
MALVPCPECGGQVSPAAVSCPHCGFPLHGAAATTAATTAASGGGLAGMAGGVVPTTETVTWQAAPSLRALAGDAVTTAIAAAVFVTAVVLLYDPVLGFVSGVSEDGPAFVAEHEAQFKMAAIAIVVISVGARLARLGWRAAALRSHRYRLSNQRLIVETGVLARSVDEIDMRTIDDVTLRQSAVQRLLGVGEITIVSADPGARRVRARAQLVGIRDPRAVRERIRDAAYQATRGQLFTRST